MGAPTYLQVEVVLTNPPREEVTLLGQGASILDAVRNAVGAVSDNG